MKAISFILVALSFQASAQVGGDTAQSITDAVENARPKSVHAGKSLEQIYSLPVAEVENIVMLQTGKCESETGLADEAAKKAGLSLAEKCAIMHYTGPGYGVNTPLWKTGPDGKALDGDQWAYVRVLDSALKKIKPEPHPADVLYRGTTTKEFKYTKKGDVVRLKGYASTSTSKDVAEGFIKDRLIIIKKSKSGRPVNAFGSAGASGEKELLFPRSTYVILESSVMKEMELFNEDLGEPQKKMVEVVTVVER